MNRMMEPGMLMKTGLVTLVLLMLGLSSLSSVAMAEAMDDQFMLLMGARNAAKAEKYETAIERYQKLVAMPGDHVEAQSELGWLLIKVGKFQEGQRAFEAVLKADPNNLTALRGRLEGARKAKDHKTENAVLTRLVRLSPQDRELRKQLAVALHNQGKYEEAEQHLAILMGEQ